MKVTDGLFLKVGERVSKEYPDIKFTNMIIDNWSEFHLIMSKSYNGER